METAPVETASVESAANPCSAKCTVGSNPAESSAAGGHDPAPVKIPVGEAAKISVAKAIKIPAMKEMSVVEIEAEPEKWGKTPIGVRVIVVVGVIVARDVVTVSIVVAAGGVIVVVLGVRCLRKLEKAQREQRRYGNEQYFSLCAHVFLHLITPDFLDFSLLDEPKRVFVHVKSKNNLK